MAFVEDSHARDDGVEIGVNVDDERALNEFRERAFAPSTFEIESCVGYPGVITQDCSRVVGGNTLESVER